MINLIKCLGKIQIDGIFCLIFLLVSNGFYYYYYYYKFSSGNRSMAILEDRQSGYIHLLYPTSNVCISVVVAQRIRLAKISVICVARLITSRRIWVKSQGLIKFILKTHYIFSGNIPDTPGERVPQITCSPGKRVISSPPRSTSRTETWYVTYATTPLIHSKGQPVFV